MKEEAELGLLVLGAAGHTAIEPEQELTSWVKGLCLLIPTTHMSKCRSVPLRKISAVRAADAGASEHELMAMFGWEDADMARRYTRKAALADWGRRRQGRAVQAPRRHAPDRALRRHRLPRLRHHRQSRRQGQAPRIPVLDHREGGA